MPITDTSPNWLTITIHTKALIHQAIHITGSKHQLGKQLGPLGRNPGNRINNILHYQKHIHKLAYKKLIEIIEAHAT